MNELLKVLTLIGTVNALTKGTWQVFHHEGPGDLDEDTATDLGEGDLTFAAGNFSYIVKGVYTKDGTLHRLRGEAGIVHLRVREKIEWDDKEVDKDDVYVSSNNVDDGKRILVEFRFKDGEALHRFRFKKEF